MENKNIVILGGTSGVGKAIALDLARENVRLVLVGRNREHAQAVLGQISAKNVSVVLGDLTTTEGQNQVAQGIRQNFDKIDVLLDTFGVFPISREINLQINLLAHAKMLALLRQNFRTGTRVALVTGNPQVLGLAPICEQQSSEMLRGVWEITHKTLLMKLWANQLSADGVWVNSFFPGDVQSNLMAWTQNLGNTKVPVGRKLALSQDFEGQTGKMFDQNGLEIALPSKYTAELAREVLSAYGI